MATTVIHICFNSLKQLINHFYHISSKKLLTDNPLFAVHCSNLLDLKYSVRPMV